MRMSLRPAIRFHSTSINLRISSGSFLPAEAIIPGSEPPINSFLIGAEVVERELRRVTADSGHASTISSRWMRILRGTNGLVQDHLTQPRLERALQYKIDFADEDPFK